MGGSILDRFRLDSRVAVITGASSGLGRAAAEGLASAGADVVLAARRADELETTAALVREHGRRALVVPTDVTDSDACHALVATAAEKFGRVDILVNSAGVPSSVPATRERPEDFRAVLDVNLCGSYWMAQACAEAMKPGASIINVSSVMGFVSLGLPQAAYSSSKAAVIGLTRDLAQQWTGRKGIRVNALVPGICATEMLAGYGGDRERLVSMMPAGRYGDPSEIAAAIVFLASDAASYVTGSALVVDGGLLTW